MTMLLVWLAFVVVAAVFGWLWPRGKAATLWFIAFTLFAWWFLGGAVALALVLGKGGHWLVKTYRGVPVNAQVSQPPTVATPDPYAQFAIYYCASKLRWAYDAEMPEGLAEIATGTVSARTEQDVIVKGHVYEQRQARPWDGSRVYDGTAMAACRTVLSREMRVARSGPAVDRWIAHEHAKEGKGPLSHEGLEKQIDEMSAMIAADPSVREKLQISVLRFNILEMFTALHGMTIEQFEDATEASAGSLAAARI